MAPDPAPPDWFADLAASDQLPASARGELLERGFVVLPGPVPPGGPAGWGLRGCCGSGRCRRHSGRLDLDQSRRFREPGFRVRLLVRLSAPARSVLPCHRHAVQAELLPRADGARACACAGAARRRASRLGRLAAARFHPDDRSLSAGQRCDALRAGVTSLAADSRRLDARPPRRTGRPGAGMRRGWLAARLRRVCLARSRCQRLRFAAPVASGRVRAEDRSCRD